MKTSIFFLYLFLTSSVFFSQNFEKKIMDISSKSQLKITGDTNINSFSCIFNPEELPKKLAVTYKREKENLLIFRNTSLKLRSKAFDCGSRPINKDFEDLIKADKYPQIFLNLKELKLLNQNSALITLNIEIAGIDKLYEVPIKINHSKSNYKGTILLNINDFKLEPPKKIFGLIKVKEEIEIEFDLYFDR